MTNSQTLSGTATIPPRPIPSFQKQKKRTHLLAYIKPMRAAVTTHI
jgi:hypothetical protein